MNGLLWPKLTLGIDEDERIVYPEMYIANPRLYDKIIGVAYLVRERGNPKAELDWVWERNLERVSKDGNVEVLVKQLIVRLRLPWNEVNFEWFVGEVELDENKDDYTVIDVLLKIQEKGRPDSVQIMTDSLEFESNRDRYEVVETRYLVCWKTSDKEEQELLNINVPGIYNKKDLYDEI